MSGVNRLANAQTQKDGGDMSELESEIKSKGTESDKGK